MVEKLIEREYFDYSKSKKGKKILVLLCDYCQKIFERSGNHARISLERRHHYCSKGCTAKSEYSKESCQLTCIKRYGATHPQKSDTVRNKTQKTCIERYGVDNPWKSNLILEKRSETWVRNYGVDNPAKSEEIQTKMKVTCYERYGHGNVWKLHSIHSKCNTQEARQKANKTLQLNDTHGRSKIEDEFFKSIVEHLPGVDAERHVMINGWCIDVRIEDMYIQFDGLYWHGLNRPIETISTSNKPRDATILKTFMRDRAQDLWFKENKIRLLRITDREFKDNPQEVIQRIVSSVAEAFNEPFKAGVQDLANDVKKILSDGKIGRVGTTR